MSYEIKTIYQAQVPVFMFMGQVTQGWYWNRETAERVIINDGGSRQGMVNEWEVICIDGDVLVAERAEDGTNMITKVTVRGDTDEDILAATLERFPEVWKECLGLEFDAVKKADQALSEVGRRPRERLLMLDVTVEEARVLGLAEDRDRAIEWFNEIVEKQDAEAGRAIPSP